MVEERDGRLRITDHKTGRPLPRHPGITGGGEVLQPTLYAQAAEKLLGKPVESGRLFYATERGGYQSFEVPSNDLSRLTLTSVIQSIDQSIAEGFLPAAPRENACQYCDYRFICGPYEQTRVHRKSQDRLARLIELRGMS
jgi:CRISPR/Cas system-associated exonuclease Cas4 (RecB family)